MNKKKKFINEFKEFAYRGNVVDMAVGVIIGAAFKAIVDSLVSDVVMPFIGIFVDTTSFTDIIIKIGNANIMIGKFIAAIINFLIIAFVIFCMVKMINKAHEKIQKPKEKEPAKEDLKPTSEDLLSEILVELKKQNENIKN